MRGRLGLAEKNVWSVRMREGIESNEEIEMD